MGTDVHRARRRRDRANFAVALLLAVSMQGAHADACNDVVQSAQRAKDDQQAKVQSDQDRIAQAQANAATCIQRIKDLLANMTAPQFPDISQISMDQIMNYLSNRACQVVQAQVNSSVIAPVNNATGNWNSQVGGAVGGVNGAVGGYTGGNVLTTTNNPSYGQTGDQGAAGGGTAKGSSAGRTSSNGGSVWDRLSCTFGGSCAK